MFDVEQVFGDDWLHFYSSLLTTERSEQDARLIAQLLALEPGERLLDVPCGHGRIAHALAATGVAVTGVDACTRALDVARQAPAAGVTFIEGDMRELALDGGYDAVLNWYGSFGYFDDHANRRLLVRWRELLLPTGRLLIELHNRDQLVRYITATHPEPRLILIRKSDDLLLDQLSYSVRDCRTLNSRTVVRDGRVSRYEGVSMRLLSPVEIETWLGDAGFTRVELFAPDGGPFRDEASRFIVVARP